MSLYASRNAGRWAKYYRYTLTVLHCWPFFRSSQASMGCSYPPFVWVTTDSTRNFREYKARASDWCLGRPTPLNSALRAMGCWIGAGTVVSHPHPHHCIGLSRRFPSPHLSHCVHSTHTIHRDTFGGNKVKGLSKLPPCSTWSMRACEHPSYICVDRETI